MTSLDAEIPVRKFEPSTTGWTAADLYDPAIERQWFDGRYEIIDGKLIEVPPHFFAESEKLANLIDRIKDHVKAEAGSPRGFARGVDVVITDQRVLRPDLVYLDPAAKFRQRAAAIAGGRGIDRSRVLVPPTLVIEMISPGHEAHDRVTKRKWYAEFGVPHYWLLDAFAPSLECLVLDGDAYRQDVVGHNDDVIRPAAFPGLVIPLAEVWEE